MDVFNAIISRRSVRVWSDQPVPDELINKILEAGRFAPSPINSQPWKLILIKNKDTLATCATKARHGAFIAHAQFVIVVVIDRTIPTDEWLSEHKQQLYSGACAIQNMWLAAWELGLGACWVTLDENSSRYLFGISDNYELIGSLAVGFPKVAPRIHTEMDRKPLSEIVSYETLTPNEK